MIINQIEFFLMTFGRFFVPVKFKSDNVNEGKDMLIINVTSTNSSLQ